MNPLSEDYQYKDSYFIIGDLWVPIIILLFVIIAGIFIYKLLRKKEITAVKQTGRKVEKILRLTSLVTIIGKKMIIDDEESKYRQIEIEWYHGIYFSFLRRRDFLFLPNILKEDSNL